MGSVSNKAWTEEEEGRKELDPSSANIKGGRRPLNQTAPSREPRCDYDRGSKEEGGAALEPRGVPNEEILGVRGRRRANPKGGRK